jgi:hypothetical protein
MGVVNACTTLHFTTSRTVLKEKRSTRLACHQCSTFLPKVPEFVKVVWWQAPEAAMVSLGNQQTVARNKRADVM